MIRRNFFSKFFLTTSSLSSSPFSSSSSIIIKNKNKNFSSSSYYYFSNFFSSLLSPHHIYSLRHHGNEGEKSKGPIPIRIQLSNGEEKQITAYEGQSLIDMAHFHSDLPVEAACAGSVACSTCHCYLENDDAMALFDEPTDEEYDMLDQAYHPKATSRLGCQLKVKAGGVHDNLKITLPKSTRNFAVDGYVAKGH